MRLDDKGKYACRVVDFLSFFCCFVTVYLLDLFQFVSRVVNVTVLFLKKGQCLYLNDIQLTLSIYFIQCKIHYLCSFHGASSLCGHWSRRKNLGGVLHPPSTPINQFFFSESQSTFHLASFRWPRKWMYCNPSHVHVAVQICQGKDKKGVDGCPNSRMD